LNEISSGKIPLNVNNLVQTDSVLSAAQRASHAKGDSAAAMAIGKVRDALHASPIESTAGDEAKAAFDVARKAAGERFGLQKAIPALKDAVDGKTSSDDFVKKYILNGKTDDVSKLASFLKDKSPESHAQAKSQIGEYLNAAAFGVDTAGDTPFATARFSKALANLGDDKLAAFFTSDEISKLKQLSRVGAYIHAIPNAAPVSTSNSGAPVTNALMQILAQKVPFGATIMGMAKNATASSAQNAAVKESIEAVIPKESSAKVLQESFIEKGNKANALSRAALYQSTGDNK
jgi:hypothetical protein